MKRNRVKLDSLDKKILEAVCKDARKPLRKVAEELGVSEPTLYSRVRSLQRRGVIKQFTVKLDMETLGYITNGFVLINVNPAKEEKIIRFLAEIPEIVEIHRLLGDNDLMVKVVCKDVSEMRKLVLEKIRELDGVELVKGFLSIKTDKDSYDDLISKIKETIENA
ncbi:MAG: Lrp/AsnC family transcriptional regulator [Candidatus Freyarchaeota archaeon]|nr:Lrp/AsnC family transcriptional regulator [Candidatus Jordarchaeia archaeon]